MGAAFLLGAGLVVFYSSANAIFLTRYDIGALPWVYIVNAAVVILVGLGYGAWSKRLSPARALVRLSAGMSVSVAGLWLWATLSDDRIVAFVMATWFRLLFIYAVIGLWEVASAVFDIRQAKRLFAAVALGMMVAFVIGGLLSPLLGSLIGTTNMVGLSAVFLAVYTIRFSRLLARHDVGNQTGSDASAPAGPREIMGDRYSRRMVWMKSVTILMLYLTEYVFYEQAADTFDSEVSLAGFLGIFMGAMTVCMVLVTGLVSGRFISRYGILVATLVLPVGMLAIAVPAGMYGVVVGVDTLFFILVTITLATNHVLGNAIGEPAGAVLFQPMPPRRRMRVRLAVDGWLGSLALVAAGLLLLLLQAIDLDSVAPYLFLIAAVAAAGVAIAVLQYRDYVATLRDVTTLGFGSDEAIRAIDLLDESALTELFGLESPGTAVAAAGLVRSLRLDPLGPFVSELLAHPEPEVVELALTSIAASGDRGHAHLVESALDRDELPDSTRRHAIETLATLDPRRALHWLAQRAAIEADRLLPAVMLMLPESRAEGVECLERLVTSPVLADRLAACRILKTAPVSLRSTDDLPAPVETMLATLLDDSDADVIDAALDASKGVVSSAVTTRLLDLAADPDHRRRALGALSRVDGDTVATVHAARSNLAPDLLADLVAHTYGGADAAIADLVHAQMPSVVRRACFDVMEPDGTAGMLLVGDDLALLSTIIESHQQLRDTSTVVALALEEEFELARTTVYGALALDHGRTKIGDLETLVSSGHDDDRATAIEALDVTVTGELRREIIGMLEHLDIDEADRSTPPSREPTNPRELLAELRDDPRLGPWTRHVAGDALDDRTTYSGATPMPPSISTVLSLKRVDIFSTLPFDVLAELAELVTRSAYAAGTVIIEQGDVGDELFALVVGAVDVVGPDGTSVRLEEHTVFGELGILDPAPRSATVTAATDVEVLRVSRRTLLALTDRRPTVMAEIARVLARRLRR